MPGIGLPAADVAILAGIATAAALAAGLLGAGLLHGLRGARLSAQTAVVALTSVVAVAVGALAAGQAMFLSLHDLRALIVVLVAAGLVGVGVGFALAGRVGRAAGSLGEVARRIGDGETLAGDAPGVAQPRELAALAGELAATAARLEEARARERALDAARRELVSWISHDLRTPLAGIRAVAEALEDGVAGEPETIARYHRLLRVEADRLAGYVDDLFELSRISAGAATVRPERLALAEVVSDALATADPLARAKDVRLDGRVHGHELTVEAAPRELGRVLRNLLANAVRETPSGGAVRVEGGVRDGQAYVAVSDGCGGIAAEDLPRVFDTGFRGQAARTPSDDAGAGLGLAIARGLVEAHGGSLTVENDGPGCRFEIRLPHAQRARA
jgi:signal transduction histidine kinase